VIDQKPQRGEAPKVRDVFSRAVPPSAKPTGIFGQKHCHQTEGLTRFAGTSTEVRLTPATAGSHQRDLGILRPSRSRNRLEVVGDWPWSVRERASRHSACGGWRKEKKRVRSITSAWWHPTGRCRTNSSRREANPAQDFAFFGRT
jgi:hypothetical protein